MNILTQTSIIADGELNRTLASAGDGYTPNSSGQVVSGFVGPELSNAFGSKFTRGYLSGEGGQDLQALSDIAFAVRPPVYNTHIQADFDAVRGSYSGEPLLPSWARSYAWGPANLFTEENIKCDWTLANQGQDPITALYRAKTFGALDGITQAPTSQYYARGQVCDGGDGLPSVSFRGDKIGKVPKPGMASKAMLRARVRGV
jgi:hypothetical protein